MPSFEHRGATIYYEEFGQGFPILTFAPAGLQSTIAVWSQPSAPINFTTEFAKNFRVLAMDQRRAFVSSCGTPCLVLAGNDEAHPRPISEELAKRLPNCELILEWKTGDALTSARARVTEFLAKHTP
jgi:hypothetical protein